MLFSPPSSQHMEKSLCFFKVTFRIFSTVTFLFLSTRICFYCLLAFVGVVVVVFLQAHLLHRSWFQYKKIFLTRKSQRSDLFKLVSLCALLIHFYTHSLVDLCNLALLHFSVLICSSFERSLLSINIRRQQSALFCMMRHLEMSLLKALLQFNFAHF